ncbi:MAG: serine protein kinase PrkA [Sandaracinaceae bacterium]
MQDPRARLNDIGAVVRDRFEAQKRVLSFGEYLELLQDNPWAYTRDAARYLRDCIDHFGHDDLDRPGGAVRRYRMFDLDFLRHGADADEGHDFLVGHERLQADFYRILSNFVREGRVNRLVLLHGPNGSAKSTFVGCLMRGLEHYSELDAGALYRFSWIFPRGSDGKVIGFGSRDALPEPGDSFAHLPDNRIDVKLTSELRESPLLLLPAQERQALLEEAYSEAGLDATAPRMLLRGELSRKNQQIYDALLTAYRGDLFKVLAHVRVERYYCSRRYQTGAVTIGPEMAVDAKERQISADRSLGALPASLSSLSLYETVGELVDAAGGVLEFSDVLKRPLDAWRYLLLAIETGEVSLTFSMLSLNSVLIASSNERHLSAFKEHHEYRSFRGRLQMVRVPYLLDYEREQGIYDAQIVPRVRGHVAPHATYVAALWATLTRLRKPQADEYENARLGGLAASLTPIEKAELYALGRIPPRLSSEEANELRVGLHAVERESDNWPIYEGISGASPREIRNLLLDAAQDPGFQCLSPLAVLNHVEAFCESDDYEFLNEKPEDGYHDHRAFVDVVRDRWLDRVDEEFRESTGLVDETQYTELFGRYVTHVSYWTKGERLENPVTGDYENPDEGLMGSVEGMLEVEEAQHEDFRRDLISAVAGHWIDNPDDGEVDYGRVFPRYLAKLRDATYGSRRAQLEAIAEAVLTVLGADERAQDELSEDSNRQAKATLDRLYADYGYTPASARDAVGELRLRRYTD